MSIDQTTPVAKPKREPPEWYTKLPKWGQISVGCLLPIVLCGALLTWVNSLPSPPPEPTAAATSLPSATDTPVAATAAAIEPTELSQATSTRRPTTTPEATPKASLAFRQYMLWAGGQLGDLGEATTTLGEQSTKAGEDITVILDDAWKLKTAVALAQFQMTASALRDREDVPPEAADLHAMLLELADEVDAIATNYAEGVDNLDAGKLAEASAGMSRVTEMSTVIGVEVDRLTDEYGD